MNVKTYARVTYNPNSSPKRFGSCANAWTDCTGGGYGVVIQSTPRDYSASIIDSGRTLAVTTWVYITVTITTPFGTKAASETLTQYTEFGYTLL